ncbi:MAG TPA: hypothetical protein VIM00_12445 [Candidatus Acidoferrum sp.]
MKILAASLAILLITAATVAAQSTTSNSPSGANPASPSGPEKPKPKAKKVWTNDEISSAGGAGGISVVGKDPDSDSKVPSKNGGSRLAHSNAERDKQIVAWRARLRQLHGQMEMTDQKIAELRNFKGDNGSAYGGIILSHKHSMTPIEEQIKTQEEKKKSIQAEIDAVEEQARKSGVEPGLLR